MQNWCTTATGIDGKGICARILPAWTKRLRSCGLLLRQAMERAETQHQINGMDAHYGTILE